MEKIPQFSDPRLLVGTETADDAGVFKIRDDLALIQTVDIFTPLVDDPYLFGQIVAANCLSDVWAMGGEVLTVLNLLGYPPKKLSTDVAAEILKGCAEKIKEIGGVLCGGHTWIDPELRVGLSVTGVIHPDRIITNAGAEPGNALILTKSIGAGILSYAHIQGEIDSVQMEPVVQSMTALNLSASQTMVEMGATACTDVTGFSLLGHAVEMAEASSISMEISASQVPIFDHVLTLAHKNRILPLGRENELSFKNQVEFHPDVSQDLIKVLFDPQTSGGLLITVPDIKKEPLMKKLQERGVTSAKIIGRIVERDKMEIRVTP